MTTLNCGGSQRVTRKSLKVQRTAGEDLVSIQRQAQSMAADIEDIIDDDLTLMLSQSQRDSGADQPSLVDLAASASQVKDNVDRIEAIIQMNQQTMLSQNRNVLKLISDISTHVGNISDRLLTLDNKVESIDNKVRSNKSTIEAIAKDISTLRKANNQKDTVVQLDRRVALVENKLSVQDNNVNNNSELRTQKFIRHNSQRLNASNNANLLL